MRRLVEYEGETDLGHLSAAVLNVLASQNVSRLVSRFLFSNPARGIYAHTPVIAQRMRRCARLLGSLGPVRKKLIEKHFSHTASLFSNELQSGERNSDSHLV